MEDRSTEKIERNEGFTDNKRLLRLPEVLCRIPVSRTSWWAGIRKGIYPSPVRLGPRTVAWKESDIDKLCNGRPDDRGF